jgi:hypothetical protein
MNRVVNPISDPSAWPFLVVVAPFLCPRVVRCGMELRVQQLARLGTTVIPLLYVLSCVCRLACGCGCLSSGNSSLDEVDWLFSLSIARVFCVLGIKGYKS